MTGPWRSCAHIRRPPWLPIPRSRADMLVKNGRYGAYIAYKGKNYRLPKGAKPEELTLDECLKIVAGSKK